MRIISLDGTWTLTRREGESLPAVVPGSVLQALLANKVIPDPFDGRNEEIAREALAHACAFERAFDAPAALLREKHLDLVFDGLDTLACVTLNGQVVARTDNMHRTWRLPVAGLLHEGTNTLRVSFEPAEAAARAEAERNPDITYVNTNGTRGSSLIRKAHYMYGWDWGPTLPDAGIWRSVRLEGYENRIENIRFAQRHEENRVTLTALIQSAAPSVRLLLYAPDGTLCAESAAVRDDADGVLKASVRVENPRLWWPNGLGDQPLYRAEVVLDEGGQPVETRGFRLGLRSLTVRTDKDAWGEEFAMCCNGVRFFAMGADYIPEDNLLGRVTREKTRRLLADCVRANFNCVRVWGGGVYPSDDFFDLCDEMGLVVWQDLMFACNVVLLPKS